MSGSDPYTDTSRCVMRLMETYVQFGPLIIAVDFDDTIYDYHKAGYVFPRVESALKKANQQGHKIIVFTCCGEESYEKIRDHYSNLDIKIDFINENIPGLPFGTDKKIFYNILLDDKAGLGQALTVLEKTLGLID